MVHVDHDARKSLILLLDNTILIWFNLVQRTIYIPLFTYHYYIGRYSGNFRRNAHINVRPNNVRTFKVQTC